MIELILYLALMLMTAEIFGWLFSRIGQPVVLGQIVGGILLGLAFPPTEEVKDISIIGVLMLLFLAGLESSVEELREAGKSGFQLPLLVLSLPSRWALRWLIPLRAPNRHSSTEL